MKQKKQNTRRTDAAPTTPANAAPYPAYKPSGVEWLGDVPKHWEIKRLKFLLQGPLQYGANESAELDDPSFPRFVRITDVDEAGNLRDETFRSLPEEVAQPYLLYEGDILFARSGATVGKTFFYKNTWGRAAYAGYLIRARLNQNIALSDFVNFITKSHFYPQWINSILIQATIQNVSAEKYASFIVPLPPLAEQAAIAGFLDGATGRIDALVDKKKRLVALLREKRTAMISRAVTQGLDPTAKRKPSGVDWLGDVPEHWNTWKTTHGYGYLGSGTTPKSDDDDYYDDDNEDGNTPWVTTSELRETVIYTTKKYVTKKAMDEHSALRVYPKDTLLFAMYGATIGRLGVLGVDAAVNQACCAFTKPKTLDPKFTFYWLLMSKPTLLAFSSGGGQPNLSKDVLCQLRIPAPAIPEQQAIADYLDKETGKIDALIAKVEAAIDKLNEYRTAIISAAVTGKIDVRGFA